MTRSALGSPSRRRPSYFNPFELSRSTPHSIRYHKCAKGDEGRIQNPAATSTPCCLLIKYKYRYLVRIQPGLPGRGRMNRNKLKQFDVKKELSRVKKPPRIKYSTQNISRPLKIIRPIKNFNKSKSSPFISKMTEESSSKIRINDLINFFGKSWLSYKYSVPERKIK